MTSNQSTVFRHLKLGLILGLLMTASNATQAKEPIVLGSISTLTGPGASPDAVRGASLYLDSVNDQGGIQGRRLVYLTEDDRSSTQNAALAARRLIANTSVVALVGGSSVVECSINHQAYANARLISIPGGGVDPMCFKSAFIAPVNAGPYVSLANALTFAYRDLQLKRLCAVVPDLPDMVIAFKEVMQEWSLRSKQPMPYMERFFIEDPIGPLLQRLHMHDCDAIVFTAPEVVEWVRAARPALPHAKHIFLTPAYTTQTLTALGALGEGIYAMAEFEPWGSSSVHMSQWRYLMTADKVPLSSLSQGGYMAAQILVNVLRSISGPINRDTVTKALRSMKPVKSNFTAKPFIVGPDERHTLNRSALPMQLTAGNWRIARHEWLTFSNE